MKYLLIVLLFVSCQQSSPDLSRIIRLRQLKNSRFDSLYKLMQQDSCIKWTYVSAFKLSSTPLKLLDSADYYNKKEGVQLRQLDSIAKDTLIYKLP